MRQPMYTNERLLELAQKNYNNLLNVCKTLDAEGYWEQPSQVLKHSIQEFLDLYVQAVLINLAVYCGRLKEDERTFIMNLPANNMTGCSLLEEEDENMLLLVKNMIKSPPILLQLCGVRDVEKDSDFTEQFFDSFLNILLSMSRLNNARDNFANGFIQEYYEKIVVFINREDGRNQITHRYIFKKISCDRLEEDLEFFLEPKEMEKPVPSIREEGYENTYIEDIEEDTEDNIEEEDIDGYKYCDEFDRYRGFQEDTEESDWENTEPDCLLQDTQEEAADNDRNAAVIHIEEQLREHAEDKLAEDLAVQKPKSKLDEYLEELNSLVGLSQVKEEIKSLINLIKVRKMRESFQMPVMDMTYHMVFTGNPGTGKTTVARLVAKIYKELGLLSKGTLVETDRSGLVAGYVGQTALKVKETVDRAIGGVLFIDEAYSLTNNVANDFGGEVIDTLVKLMEDHRDNLVVIVAGYKDEMKNFLDSNTGLVSRFNKFIEFGDYSVEELIAILESMASQAGVFLSEEAIEYIKNKISGFSSEEFKIFGNARGIRNVFEKIMMNQANRLVTMEDLTKEQLSQVTLDDMEGILA